MMTYTSGPTTRPVGHVRPIYKFGAAHAKIKI